MNTHLLLPGITAVATTTIGNCRTRQEDSYLLHELKTSNYTLPLMVVCDGMGGANGGDTASQLAVQVMANHATHVGCDATVESVAKFLVDALTIADRFVYEFSRRNTALRGMGATCTACVIVQGHLVAAQIGDSRAYVIRNGCLTQVTRDQSLAQRMLETGQLRPEDLESFQFSNIILQALGTTGDALVDITICRLKPSDLVLICSDGIHGQLNKQMLLKLTANGSISHEHETIVSSEDIQRRLQTTAVALCDAANDAGGHDNATCICVHVSPQAVEGAIDLSPPSTNNGTIDQSEGGDLHRVSGADDEVIVTRYTLPSYPSEPPQQTFHEENHDEILSKSGAVQATVLPYREPPTPLDSAPTSDHVELPIKKNNLFLVTGALVGLLAIFLYYYAG